VPSLAGLADTVADAAVLIRARNAALASLSDRIEAVVTPLQAVIRTVPAAEALASTSYAEWLHAVRNHVNAIAGWAVVLRQTRDMGTQKRGAAALDRNIVALEDLVARVPAGTDEA
jgi:hypothetical protein